MYTFISLFISLMISYYIYCDIRKTNDIPINFYHNLTDDEKYSIPIIYYNNLIYFED